MDCADSTPTTRTTVLIIDDNYNDRKYWASALRESSFDYLMLEASDAEDGRRILQKQKVDCVLLDFDMPLSGFFTLLELVPDRERPKIAVIMLTCLVHPVWPELTKQNGGTLRLRPRGRDDLAGQTVKPVGKSRMRLSKRSRCNMTCERCGGFLLES